MKRRAAFLRRGIRDESGQSLIEFMLVLPMLLVLVIGIIEFGNAWRTSQTLANVARDVVRAAVVANPPTSTQLEAIARSRLTNSGLDGSKANVTLNLCSGACTGDPDQVTISYPFTFELFGRVVGLICGSCGDSWGSITLSSTTVMRNE